MTEKFRMDIVGTHVETNREKNSYYLLLPNIAISDKQV